ncbi:hypothetical protein ST37_13955 [Vibrio sp. qd031]|uniref:hypothetical protein n=1 Tax=Vibrio sp. qd031 TaxID=1603038 RepID=UPI000A116EF1|nr:hypothetical protein [Vibrio sp. qd031]ORT49497.1 hypothetical protein ST37_13955 [Vibrio sp. qd031]
MNKLSTLALTVGFAIAASAQASPFFTDSTLDLKWRVNYYDIEGEGAKSQIPVSLGEVVALKPELAAMIPDPSMLAMQMQADLVNDMSINDFGTAAWLNWHSGWLANVFAVEVEYQGAAIFDQSGQFSSTYSAEIPGMGLATDTLSMDNPYFYRPDSDASYVGKLGNANARLRVGDDKSNTQLVVGRMTPTIYNLLHRPDTIYYALHQVYEGLSLQGDYPLWGGFIQPWASYYTGFSSEYNEQTINFKDDLDPNYSANGLNTYLNGSYDAIINVGFHTETDYFTSSASFSYAEDYLSNGIIEVYSGIPYSLFGIGDSEYDKDHFIKYMGKVGYEQGKGVNSEHKTDVWEVAAGLQHGGLDFLLGMTQIGDQKFAGFETQGSEKAGGGTAVWGDMAILNRFDLPGQRTYFLVGGYNFEAFGMPGWRVQGVVANANGTDLNELALMDRVLSPNEDYTEYNIDFMYTDSGYQGDGMSYVLKIGKDTNFNAFGFGLFVEYNGDLTNLF